LGEDKMSKLKLITLAASIMLAITFTISCSDDKDDPPAYLTCDELRKLMQEGFMEGNPGVYMDNLGNKCQLEHISEIQKCSNRSCGEDIVLACMQNDKDVKKLCGGASMKECGPHYDALECD
jgi:hypothetical protein